MILPCKDIAAQWENEIPKNSGAKLVVITTDAADPASKVYMCNKKRACERCGILYEEIVLNASTPQYLMLSTIRLLNQDPTVSGIIVQLPLPKHFNVAQIQKAIDPAKDVDGFHPNSKFTPCTPHAVMQLLADCNLNVEGKHCVVIGRSKIVGEPLQKLLLAANATVSVAHSRTPKPLLQSLCANASYIFCAAGVPSLVNFPLENKPVIIDISINRTPDGKLCGDADPSVYPYCEHYTSVPGGIGPLTVAMLMRHTYEAAP